MLIRRMVESDLDAVERLAAASSPDATIWTRSQHLEVLAKHDLYETLVAEEAGSVAGFLYFHVMGEEAELDNLAVDPLWRRRGIGAQLLESAWQRARERGALAIFLEVRRSNTTALRLYARMGFLQLGTRASYYTNPSEDAIRLVRRRLQISDGKT